MSPWDDPVLLVSSICNRPLTSLSLAVHHLRYSVHCGSAQHDQKNSECLFFHLTKDKNWFAFSLKFILRRSEPNVLHCTTRSVTSSLHQLVNRCAVFLIDGLLLDSACSQRHQCMTCLQHAWIFLPQVTISLAMTIVSLLATIWTIIYVSSSIAHSYTFDRHPMYLEDNITESEYLWSQRFIVSHLSVIISCLLSQTWNKQIKKKRLIMSALTAARHAWINLQ